MRLFLAIDLPGDVKRRLAERTVAESSSLPKARWVQAETLHLTLAFLGEVDPNLVPRIDEVLTPIFASWAPMPARVGAGGAFPARGKARVLWADFQTNGDLAGLHADAEAALAAVPSGDEPLYVPEPRPFHPHVTVARCRTAWPRQAVERWAASFGDPGLEFRIEHGTLFESELSPAGARYRAVSTYPLAADAPAA